MRSAHADAFNHDDEASGYDADVLNEAHPIRAGYDAVLDWVVAQADVQPQGRVLDLGSGTGNLTQRLPDCSRIDCLDISENMQTIAREKLHDRTAVYFATGDLLEWIEAKSSTYDAVVSTYAVHHLTPKEKPMLFDALAQRLAPNGRMVFGDLMFADKASRIHLLTEYRDSGQGELADDIEDEFFWDVHDAVTHLTALGFRVASRQFSRLSWGVAAFRTGQP